MHLNATNQLKSTIELGVFQTEMIDWLRGKKLDVQEFRFKNMKLSKIEKVPRGFQDEKWSKDMASSRNLVSIIGAQASSKRGDGTRCLEG